MRWRFNSHLSLNTFKLSLNWTKTCLNFKSLGDVVRFGRMPMYGIWVTSQFTYGLIWGPNLNSKRSPYPNWYPNPNHNQNRNHWLSNWDPNPNQNHNPNHNGNHRSSNRSKPKLNARCKVIMTYNIQFPVHGHLAVSPLIGAIEYHYQRQLMVPITLILVKK